MTWKITPGWTPADSNAAAYIAAVEAADGQALENGVKVAIDNFVLGCKADGIWNAIKASCILAGARTLNGALVSLVGPAPTNFNFVSGDYNRKTGLVGNGSTKYLNSNIAPNAMPQNSIHISAHRSSVASSPSSLMGCRGNADLAGDTLLLDTNTNGSTPFRLNCSAGAVNTGSRASNSTGFAGATRSSSGSITSRISGSNETISDTSTTPVSRSIYVFARNNQGTTDAYTNARMTFYSIGESIDLAALDTRATALITAIGAAIP